MNRQQTCEMSENGSVCDLFSFFSHQGHLWWLPTWFWFFLRLHRFVEQPVSHPGRLVQCQLVHETLQKVKLRQQPQVAFRNVLWWFRHTSIVFCKIGDLFVWMLNLYNTKTYDVMDEYIRLTWLFLFFSRSTEEVIALFISIAFVGDAVKGTVKSKSVWGQNTFSAFLWLRGNDTSMLLFFINIKSSQKTYSPSCVFWKNR